MNNELNKKLEDLEGALERLKISTIIGFVLFGTINLVFIMSLIK